MFVSNIHAVLSVSDLLFFVIGVGMQSVWFMTWSGIYLPSEDQIMPKKFVVVWSLWTLLGLIVHPLSVKNSVNSTFDASLFFQVITRNRSIINKRNTGLCVC